MLSHGLTRQLRQVKKGRALLMQERDDEAMTEFAAAEWLFEAIGSVSHLAAAWTAQGDAYQAAGDLEAAAALFRTGLGQCGEPDYKIRRE